MFLNCIARSLTMQRFFHLGPEAQRSLNATRAIHLLPVFCLFHIAAFAQVQRPDLLAALKGKEATSVVAIGDSGFPAGDRTGYPLAVSTVGFAVSTLGSPDGQITYKIEGVPGGEAVRMRRSFGVGTEFEIKRVDLKNDHLELKLEARNGDSGRLRSCSALAGRVE